MAHNIDVTGLDEAERKLARLAVELLDLRPFWPRLVPLFIGWMRSQFETQGAFAGHPWAPLSPRYAAWKASRYPGRPILQLERDLKQAASRPSRTVTANTLTLTINDPKLAYLQKGTPHMPARPLVFDALPLVARHEVDEAAEDYVLGVARRAGLL